MHPQAEALAAQFRADFWAADHAIRWTAAEREYALWLDDRTVVLSKIDAEGINAESQPFFADWKSISKNRARNMDAEKLKWRMSPQALTYGLVKGDCRLFTVRWAVKDDPVRTFFEWYTYTEEELLWWREELRDIAAEIRHLRSRKLGETHHWPLNLDNCSRYGEKYRCKFRDNGCWKRNFEFVPEGMVKRAESHLNIENELRAAGRLGSDVVVLGATRVDDFMSCREYNRRMWEGEGLREGGEALQIGADFHELQAKHITAIMKEQEEGNVKVKEISTENAD